jgi:amino-acid N-acetyltransferase
MDSTAYAQWFRSSTPYIQAHRGRTFVALLPGEALGHGNLVNIVHDLALVQVLGARLVLVHGARPQIDAALGSSVGERPRRITRSEDLATLQMVHGELRARLEARFSSGLPNTPLHGTDIAVASGNLVVAQPVGILDGVDHQFTGTVRRVHKERLNGLLDSGAIVLMSPLGYSPSGQTFNLASDELAAATAQAIGADKLIVFDEARQLPGPDGAPASTLDPASLAQALERAALPAPTSQRASALLQAVRAGVPRGHLVSYIEDGALLTELYTASGHGTQISEDDPTPIRQAQQDDIAGIVALIRPLERAGVLVRRSRDRLEAEIEHFYVAEVDGIVIGCCALFLYRDMDAETVSAELACIAVHPSYRDGLGRALLARAEREAARGGATALFVLTTQTQDWFADRGFAPASREALPAPRQALYNDQRGSLVMTKKL